ncbi:MAG TPA: LytTR family DNA-binding domain-containing protein, partial [Thermoanaerobaculia bacterium]|nr:LytTR family DNA-binding domain-containing protein [Thermoanaerobaculia bacterium]
MPARPHRLLVHLADGRRVPLDPEEIYYLEAQEADTVVRTRSKRLLHDVRSLGQIEPLLAAWPFARIHRALLVNLHRVRELRPRRGARGWEVVLAAPVNKVLPVAEGRVREL